MKKHSKTAITNDRGWSYIETAIAMSILLTVAFVLSLGIKTNKRATISLSAASDCNQLARSFTNYITNFEANNHIRNVPGAIEDNYDFSNSQSLKPLKNDILYSPVKQNPLLKDSGFYYASEGIKIVVHGGKLNAHGSFTHLNIRNSMTWAMNLYNNHLLMGNNPNLCEEGITFRDSGIYTFEDLAELMPGSINLHINENGKIRDDIEAINLKIQRVDLRQSTDKALPCSPTLIYYNQPFGYKISFTVSIKDTIRTLASEKGNTEVKTCTSETVVNYRGNTGKVGQVPNIPKPILNGGGVEVTLCTCPNGGCGTEMNTIKTPEIVFNQPGVSLFCKTSGPAFFSSTPDDKYKYCSELGAKLIPNHKSYNDPTRVTLEFNNLSPSSDLSSIEIVGVSVSGEAISILEGSNKKFKVHSPTCPSNIACGQTASDGCGGICYGPPCPPPDESANLSDVPSGGSIQITTGSTTGGSSGIEAGFGPGSGGSGTDTGAGGGSSGSEDGTGTETGGGGSTDAGTSTGGSTGSSGSSSGSDTSSGNSSGSSSSGSGSDSTTAGGSGALPPQSLPPGCLNTNYIVACHVDGGAGPSFSFNDCWGKKFNCLDACSNHFGDAIKTVTGCAVTTSYLPRCANGLDYAGNAICPAPGIWALHFYQGKCTCN